jgi:antitoxin component YwqK of YwqJK toxin-antitoxin module
MRQKLHVFGFVLILLLFTACASKKQASDELAFLQITDRNGLCETISNKNKLNNYKNFNFKSFQPFKKVVQVFEKHNKAKNKSIITSYHENGSLHKYLEAQNGRAFGKFIEKHPNGNFKVEANVIAGPADFSAFSETEWIFDGTCKAYDERGSLLSEIFYKKGSLEKTSTYFYPTGQIQKIVPFAFNEVQGDVITYFPNGDIESKSFYKNSLKNGTSIHYWEKEKIQSEENFDNDKITFSKYFDKNDSTKIISSINDGCGTKAIFKNGLLHKLEEYKNGSQEGFIKVFKNNQLSQKYYNKNNKKNGLDTTYFLNHELDEPTNQGSKNYPKLEISYKDDAIHGIVKTYYQNSKLESQKEFCQNILNGSSCAWFLDGSLMFLEEYEKGKLIKAKYFKRSQKNPISSILNGNGSAVLYDKDGVLINKITYVNGSAVDEGDDD